MKKEKAKAIPAPPEDTASPEELAAYYEKYSPQELIDAGHMQVLAEDDPRVQRHRAIGAELREKRRRAQLNIVLTESELSDLAAYAEEIHIPVSTIAKSWILRALKVEKGKLSQTHI